MLNFSLYDDNPKMLDRLSNMLNLIFEKHKLDSNIVHTFTNYNELLSYMETNTVDVITLDINLHSDLNGIQLANKIRKLNKDCYIIFITAHCEFVFMAYKCKTFDYICKPFTVERLEDSILRLFDDIKNSKSQNKYIKIDNKNTIILENEIQYIKKDGMQIIYCTNHQDYKAYSSFSKIENKLPSNFVRCHKSFIANINNITKLELSSNSIYFRNNFKCDIGPKYKEKFMKGFNIYEKYS